MSEFKEQSKYRELFCKEFGHAWYGRGSELFPDTLNPTRKYSDWLEKRLEEAEGFRERLRESCIELVQAMHDYEMLQEDCPPFKHRDMMERAKEAIENREPFAEPTPGTETPDPESEEEK